MRRPTSAHAIALLALFVALSGGAYAALKIPRNSVGPAAIRNGAVKAADLAKGAVRARQVKDGALGTTELADGSVTQPKLAAGAVGAGQLAAGGVGAAQLADGAVTGAKIADGQVGAAELAAPEAPRLVGTPGQPAFGTGGENDCVWSNALIEDTSPAQPYAAVGFSKDPLGRVHLEGVAMAKDAPGGDAKCGGADEFTADATVFVLPKEYRPARLTALATTNGADTLMVVVNGDEPVVTGSTTIPPGVVLLAGGAKATAVSFDGLEFRAATAATRRSGGRPVHLSGEGLELLLGR